nr:ABC transporter substrate-binding protein [Kineococcus aurantiacus]
MSACSGGSPSGPTGGASTGTAGFPVTVPTAFGDVTVPAAPRRVVALGWGDAETALALGVQPVGASDWLAFGGEGVGPWATGLYDTAPEVIGTLEPSYEAVAALRPDLVLDVKSSGDRDRHDTLSAIAPTIGIPTGGEDYLTTPQQQVTAIAAALGRSELGQELLQRNDDAFAAAAAAHPGWEGATFTAASRTTRGWGAYVEGSERVGFAERLGFVQNPAIAALPVGESGFSVPISAEQLEVVDADVVVVFPIGVPAGDVTADPVFRAVPAVAAGRSLVLDRDVASAYALSSVLSTRWALERVVPLLEGLGDLP